MISYKELTDKQIVALIITPPHNEEAAAYLLYTRYRPVLRRTYKDLTEEKYGCGDLWYYDCVNDLFLHLKGKNKNWHTLATFDWRSSLGTWLKKVSRNQFISSLSELIDKQGRFISIDTDDPDKPKVQLPDGGEEDYERRLRKVELLEAVGQLEDEDQKFVVLKRLQGYDSKEIAILLQKRWQKHGIKKYNKKNELVIPTAGYIDVRMQRAKDNLRSIIGKL